MRELSRGPEVHDPSVAHWARASRSVESRVAPSEPERVLWLALRASQLGVRFRRQVDVAEASGGVLNFNDAALVLLQQQGTIGDVATFDANPAGANGFRVFTT